MPSVLYLLSLGVLNWVGHKTRKREGQPRRVAVRSVPIPWRASTTRSPDSCCAPSASAAWARRGCPGCGGRVGFALGVSVAGLVMGVAESAQSGTPFDPDGWLVFLFKETT